MIKSARKRKRLTQKELANIVGVSQSYISRLERRQMPTIGDIDVKTILRLSKVLELDQVDVFIFITSYQNSK